MPCQEDKVFDILRKLYSIFYYNLVLINSSASYCRRPIGLKFECLLQADIKRRRSAMMNLMPGKIILNGFA